MTRSKVGDLRLGRWAAILVAIAVGGGPAAAAPAAAAAAPSAAAAAGPTKKAKRTKRTKRTKVAAPLLPPSATPLLPPPPKPPGKDVHTSNVFLAPTAVTPAAGTLSLHSYELVSLGVTGSPTDWLSLSGSSVGQGGRFNWVVSGKLQFYRGERSSAALHGAGLSFGGTMRAQVAGAVVTSCMDVRCASFVNSYLGVVRWRDAGDLDARRSASRFNGVVLAVGAVSRFSERGRFFTELGTGGALTGEPAVGSGMLALWGLRFSGQRAGLDVGMAHPLVKDAGLLVLGLPILRATVRL